VNKINIYLAHGLNLINLLKISGYFPIQINIDAQLVRAEEDCFLNFKVVGNEYTRNIFLFNLNTGFLNREEFHFK
jgi:hypothetical protein